MNRVGIRRRRLRVGIQSVRTVGRVSAVDSARTVAATAIAFADRLMAFDKRVRHDPPFRLRHDEIKQSGRDAVPVLEGGYYGIFTD